MTGALLIHRPRDHSSFKLVISLNNDPNRTHRWSLSSVSTAEAKYWRSQIYTSARNGNPFDVMADNTGHRLLSAENRELVPFRDI
jgi:hypothetical protein